LAGRQEIHPSVILENWRAIYLEGEEAAFASRQSSARIVAIVT
jgi:hypothetical protein